MQHHLVKILLVAYCFQSCSSLYVPSSVQAPLLNRGNEFQGEVNIGTNGGDLKAAYAISHHIVGMGMGTYYNFMGNSNLYSEFLLGYYFSEFATGGYSAISPGVRLEILGGAGIGSSKTKETGNSFLKIENRKADLYAPSSGMFTNYIGQINFAVGTDFKDFGTTIMIQKIQYKFNSMSENSGDTKVDDILFGNYYFVRRKINKQFGYIVQIGYKYAKDSNLGTKFIHFSFGVTYKMRK